MTALAPGWQRTNLPLEVTSFVGRHREVSEAKQLLRRHRLLTVTGVAGIGKTRLALRVAAQLLPTVPDGVWLAELTTLADDKLLAHTVTNALGISDHSAEPPLDILTKHLEDKQLLLVLDGCEHLLDTCAVLADELLAVAPGLRILVTSRQALRAADEQLLEVPPLPVPDLGKSNTNGNPARYDAVSLFAERAAAAMRGFSITTDNRATVARLCQRLDGIPLAIELAALRVRTMSPAQILDQLDHHFDVLAEESHTEVPGPRTLRATIDWSFNLCSDSEQTLWARASVFAGGFDLEDAEQVCSGETIAREDVLGLVTKLVDKSILIRENHHARTRYRLLETIREYGQERLASSGQQLALRTRHRNHYRCLAERAETDWFSPRQVDWLTRLRREHVNLRTALEFCLSEHGQARAGLQMSAALGNYWVLSGSITEGRDWLDHVLELDSAPTPARAKALRVNAWLAFLQTDLTMGLPMLEQSYNLTQRSRDESALAHVMRISGMAVFFQGDIPRAITFFEEALARHRAAGDINGVWTALLELTLTFTVCGDADHAIRYGEECLAVAEIHGAHVSRSYALWALGLSRWLSGARQEASALILDSIRAQHSFSDQWGIAHCLEILAWTLPEEGHSDCAARLLGAAHVLWRSFGTAPSRLSYLATPHEQCEARTREDLGDQEYAAAFNHGTRLPLDQVVSYVLQKEP